MNLYEAACERLERANRNLKTAKAEARRILTEAEVEWNEADDNLRQHQVSPGIPLPEYREHAFVYPYASDSATEAQS